MYIYMRPVYWPKPYTFWTFLWDLFWFCMTGGFWIFYVAYRQHRRNRQYYYPWW